MSKKLKLTITAIIAVIVISPFVYGQIKSIQKKQTDYNKKRLIELSISREKIFWDCQKARLVEENNKWIASDDYKKQNSAYQECINHSNEGYKTIFYLLSSEASCRELRPDNRWEQSNELASQYCSQKADESEDGRLRSKFRKKVPASDLTDNEIKEEIKNKKYER